MASAQKVRFKPGVYVFPGGMIERADHDAYAVAGLDQALAEKLDVGGSQRRGHALAMDAVRETFEETGLVAGAPGDVGPSSDPTWSHFRKIGQAPDLSRLGYLGRAVTPTAQPMRFHARFFFIAAGHLSGTINPSEELEDLQWLALSDRGRLPMMQVTEFMMDILAGRLSGEISQAPFISFNNGKPRTVWQ